ncbi:hypothetical protein BGC_32800 [Burkholderia sp. 3C]
MIPFEKKENGGPWTGRRARRRGSIREGGYRRGAPCTAYRGGPKVRNVRMANGTAGSEGGLALADMSCRRSGKAA